MSTQGLAFLLGQPEQTKQTFLFPGTFSEDLSWLVFSGALIPPGVDVSPVLGSLELLGCLLPLAPLAPLGD